MNGDFIWITCLQRYRVVKGSDIKTNNLKDINFCGKRGISRHMIWLLTVYINDTIASKPKLIAKCKLVTEQKIDHLGNEKSMSGHGLFL